MSKGHTRETRAPVVLVLIDVINDFSFPEARQLVRHAIPMARRIAALKQRCARAGIPAIYVNDNFGQWRSCLDEQIEHCLARATPGTAVVEALLPQPDDYFILKPKRSAFFATPLDVLLQELGTHTLILTGVATDICVYFTASDANMRNYQLYVPGDCVAANTSALNRDALKKMKSLLKARIRSSAQLDLRQLQRG